MDFEGAFAFFVLGAAFAAGAFAGLAAGVAAGLAGTGEGFDAEVEGAAEGIVGEAVAVGDAFREQLFRAVSGHSFLVSGRYEV